jgi:hypothetical protein
MCKHTNLELTIGFLLARPPQNTLGEPAIPSGLSHNSHDQPLPQTEVILRNAGRVNTKQ